MALRSPSSNTAGGSPITGTVITATTNFLAADGTKAAPSYAFSSNPGSGWYWRSALTTGLAGNSGKEVAQFTTAGNFSIGGNQLGLSSSGSGDLSVSGADTLLFADAANTMALKNANNAQEYRIYAGNGGFLSIVKSITESLTIAAAATTTGVTSIPAGAILLAVSVRVTTVIPTAATFTVTTTVGGTTLNTAAVNVAAGSTDPGTAGGASFRSASTTVVITPNLQPATATGVVRLQYYYIQSTPATS